MNTEKIRLGKILPVFLTFIVMGFVDIVIMLFFIAFLPLSSEGKKVKINPFTFSF